MLLPRYLGFDLRAMPGLTELAGNSPMPGSTAPKLEWLCCHEPDCFVRMAEELLPKDYPRCRMTGAMASHTTHAAGTQWLDVSGRAWSSDELLKSAGMRRGHMTDPVEGSQPSAHLSATFAADWGMAPDVIAAGGAGQHAASAVGIGAVKPRGGLLSLGTSGVLPVTTDGSVPVRRRRRRGARSA
jgi:xylulokinase